MLALGTMAMTVADVAFFSPPPHRPERPARSISGGAGAIRGLIRAVRREVAMAAEAGNGFPRASHYPY